ncbi:hypothetical protein [Roseateles sp. LYH14W]|uniref:Uncharacterized protein n=1 Tax=Pelomonas parva TaxID=3299032 RepID=A0ABW7EVM0_9BURK
MTLNASLRNRVRRLEALAAPPVPVVAGLLLRPGIGQVEAQCRFDAVRGIAETLYVANLARVPLRKD